MKKNIAKITSAVVLATVLSTSAVASEAQQFGLGVGVTGDATTLRGTVSLDDGLRLEPYFGFSYLSPKTGNSQSDLQIGSALHMVQAINNDINAYYGGFVGIGNTDNGVSAVTTFNLGPVAGVEYKLDKQFTLGAEMRMNFGFGDDTVIGTNSSVLLRYYF
ncbi:hypothetical protein [Sulfurimonas sp.]|uniref:hypothetical protein n=1 Tax=Sulfurimonas sp. TaxID=2022749 RepID=UPI002616AF1E|nr:hypothetical protein [Sulfurimonas sp.]